jgi:hypothetical protein
MTPSDKMKDQGEKAAADYDAHLTKAENHLEASARKAETSFKEHTAAPEVHLEDAEDDMEAAAHKAETQAAERDAQVRERISQTREHVSKGPVVEPGGATGGPTMRSAGAPSRLPRAGTRHRRPRPRWLVS